MDAGAVKVSPVVVAKLHPFPLVMETAEDAMLKVRVLALLELIDPVVML
jgi:hypothetical protein